MSNDHITKFNNGQHNIYSNFTDESHHEHTWYRPSTGQMGWHGSDADKATKKASGQSAHDSARSVYDPNRWDQH